MTTAAITNPVLFRNQWLVQGLYGLFGELSLVGLADEPAAHFELRRRTEDELRDRPWLPYIATLQVERTAPQSVLGELSTQVARIQSAGLPLDGRPLELFQELTVDRMRLITDLSSFAPPLRAFVEDVWTDVPSRIHDVLGVIGWRSGLTLPPSHEPANRLACSVDRGGSWHALPKYHVVYTRKPDFLGAAKIAEAEGALKTEVDEPFGHELWREAWNLRGTAPRSAVQMAFAGLETGFMSLVTNLAPTAVPAKTPPLEKMLGHALSSLTIRGERGVTRVRVDATLIADLRKWKELRNAFMHGGAVGSRDVPGTLDDFEAFTLLVRDLLWLFDYSAGRHWAREYIQPATWQKVSFR